MFETLDEEIEITEGGRRSVAAWMARFAEIALVLIAFFGALYFAIVSFE